MPDPSPPVLETPPVPPVNLAAAPPAGPAPPAPPAEPAPPAAPAAAPPEPPPQSPPTTADLPSADVRVVPKTEEYKLPEGMPQSIAEFAHTNEFTQAQLDATITNFGGYVQASKTAEQTAIRQAGEAYMATEWGEAKTSNLALAKQALAQNDPSGDLSKALDETGFGSHPAVLSFLYGLGKSLQEGGFIKSAPNTPKGQKTVAQRMYPTHDK